MSGFKTFSINIRGRLTTISRPWIMGILNVTPDSFYANSRTFDDEAIASRTMQLITDGADIIDIGGYSSRPGADDVSPEEEYARLKRGIETVKKIYKDMYPTIARLHVPYIIMHMHGTPATMQTLCNYPHGVTADAVSELALKIDRLRQLGICDIIVDPGFGFSKTIEQNYKLFNDIEEFHLLNLPLLVGISRKSMIYKLLNIHLEDSLNGTTVLNTAALLHGVHFLRVHDVSQAVETAKIIGALTQNYKYN